MIKKMFLFVFGLVVINTIALAQTQITGKVTDEQGNPIVKATILEKGTKNGVPTNEDGNFKISLKKLKTILVISAVGFQSVEVTKIQDFNNIILVKKEEVLDGVVVVAFGTSSKKKSTGSSVTVTAGDFSNRPTSNILNTITGSAPGVITTSANGQPGSAPTIRIRGFGSINASSDPLYVVDGVPYGNGIQNINSDDIESYSILKDAASTSLYGSRAANGVIIITTKKGIIGDPTVNFRIENAVNSRAINEYDRLNPFQYYEIEWEAYRNSLLYANNPISLDSANRVASGLTSRAGIFDQLKNNPFNVKNNQIVGVNGKINPNAQLLYPGDLDWNQYLIRKPSRGNYTLSLNGADKKIDYFFSLGYLNDIGYIIKSDFERYTIRANVNSKVKNWLKMGTNLSGSISSSNTANDGTTNAYVNPFYSTRTIASIYPVFTHDSVGNFIKDPLTKQNAYDLSATSRASGAGPGRNVVAETNYNITKFKTNLWSIRSYADINLLKELKFTFNAGYDINVYAAQEYGNTLVGDAAPSGAGSNTQFQREVINLNQLLNYTKKINNIHSIDILLGHESFNRIYSLFTGSRSNVIVPNNFELINFTTTTNISSSSTNYNVEGYFSRLNYGYKDKYFLTGSFRRDGSSRFFVDNRFGNFYSVSAAWLLSSESFIKKIPWVDYLKLRGSIGQTGNDDVNTFYAWQAFYNLGNNNATEPGILLASVENKNLVWEVNTQKDIALEFTLFKNKVNGTFEYFHRVSDNLLFSLPLPLSTGFTSVNKNVGSMVNKGFELNLSINILKTKDFNWILENNVTILKNVILALPDQFQASGIITGTKKYLANQSIYDYWLRDWRGVDSSNGREIYSKDPKTTYNTNTDKIIKTGDTVTNDYNKANYKYNGSAIPDFYGSIKNTFSYKQFTLSVLLTYQIGGFIYDNGYATLMHNGTYGTAFSTDVLNRWQKPGDITNVPRVQNGLTSVGSSRWLIDASYLNIRSVSFSYILPKNISQKLKLNSLQAYISAENLMLLSKRNGLDVTQTFSGVTSNSYTPTRTISFGITGNF